MSRDIWRMLVVLILILGAGLYTLGAPEGVEIVSNTTETPTLREAAALTTAGGSFTTLILNATSQTIKWKAYVGNITGDLRLRDGQNYSIYKWDLTTVTGEVYASRNSSISWGNIRCIDDTILTIEESDLNISTLDVDSINQTFNDSVHRGFYVGTEQILQSDCRAIATYVNDSEQTPSPNADFQVILLDDTVSTVYATIINDNTQGYNNLPFDFQMIVAEDPTTAIASTYYFWAELG